MRVDPSVFGAELATFRRRLAAFLVDLLLVGLLSLPSLFLLSWIAMKTNSPHTLELIGELRRCDDPEEKELLWHQLNVATAHLIYQRMPDQMPEDFQRAIVANDSLALDSLVREYDWAFDLSFGNDEKVVINPERKEVDVGLYVYLGRVSFLANIGFMFIVYFTLATWLMRGYTPGKWIVRIRVIRLDTRRLTLWNSFGRAGGYSASVATLGIGFLEALWHPNRQAVHDRISETVVMRVKKSTGS